MRRYNLHFILLALSCLVPAGAFACSNPPGDAGDQIYNTTYNVMQYCNGTNWVAMGTHGAIAGDNLGSHAASDELDMGGFRIENVGPPTGGTHAATKDYVDTALGAIPAPATPNLAAVIAQGNSAGNSRITNVSAPSADSDAATKEYVDTVVASGSGGGGCGHIPDCAEHGGTWGWNNGVWSCSRPNYYAWGNNQNGQYGNGTVVASYSPALVTLTVSQPMTSVAMSSSQYYACGVAENSMLWCWGTNQYGQLGIGSKSTNPPYEVSPRPVTGLWKSVSPGNSHTCGIRSDNSLWCWGLNGSAGQLGNNSDVESLAPVRENTNSLWQSVSAGTYHTCAINSSNRLLCWGGNSNGQLGRGNTSNAMAPLMIGSDNWKQVSAGWDHTCGIKADNTLWCWGRQQYGRLGNNATASANITSPVQIHGGGSWKQVAAGGLMTCGIKTDNSLWCWGYGSGGALGNGLTTDMGVPQAVAVGASWKLVASGYYSSCAIKTDDTLWCWGNNGSGQLGVADTTHRLEPVQVYGGGVWDSVSIGSSSNSSVIAIPKVSTGGSNTTPAAAIYDSFETWSAGANLPPDGWAITGNTSGGASYSITRGTTSRYVSGGVPVSDGSYSVILSADNGGVVGSSASVEISRTFDLTGLNTLSYDEPGGIPSEKSSFHEIYVGSTKVHGPSNVVPGSTKTADVSSFNGPHVVTIKRYTNTYSYGGFIGIIDNFRIEP